MTWQYCASGAIGIGLLTFAMSGTTAGPAIAQGVLKPVQAFIVNTSANPVPVRNVDDARDEAFQAKAEIGDSFEVPAGKQLVIEFVSGRVDTDATCPAAALVIFTTPDSQPSLSHFFTLPLVRT